MCSDASFPRDARLLEAAGYGQVFKRNKRLTNRYWIVLAHRSGSDHSRLGLAIAKKRAKRAVDRNRIKRIARESFRHNRVLLKGYDYANHSIHYGLNWSTKSNGHTRMVRLILFYQRWISPLSPPRCRFYPSCSEYALDAIKLHGTLKGSYLATKRVCRCHPLSAGGYDPVPGSNVESTDQKNNTASKSSWCEMPRCAATGNQKS